METQHTLKVVLVGPSGAGKTTVQKQYTRNGDVNSTPQPTIGMEFGTVTRFARGRNYRVQLWDTAGQARFAAITDSAFPNSDAIIGVVDLDHAHREMMKRSRSSSANNMSELIAEYLKVELERIRQALRIVSNTIPRPKFVLLGNKIDLLTGDQIQYEEVAIRNALKQIAEGEMNGSYFDVSALTGAGVDDAFQEALSGASRVYDIKHNLVRQNAPIRERPLAPTFPVDSSVDEDEDDLLSRPSWTFQRRQSLDDEDDADYALATHSMIFPWWRRLLCCV